MENLTEFMIASLKTNTKDDLLLAEDWELCECNHCEKIKEQQLESENRWIRLHQLFDR